MYPHIVWILQNGHGHKDNKNIFCKTRDKPVTRDIENLNLFQRFKGGVSFKRHHTYIKQKHFYE